MGPFEFKLRPWQQDMVKTLARQWRGRRGTKYSAGCRAPGCRLRSPENNQLSQASAPKELITAGWAMEWAKKYFKGFLSIRAEQQ